MPDLTGTIALGSIKNRHLSVAADIDHAKMSLRSNAIDPIALSAFRVWDSVTQPLPGEGTAEAGVFAAHFAYNPSSVDTPFFVAAGRAFRVVGIIGRVEVAGTDGGTVTAVVKKAASATAITSGTALHSSTYNLKGSAATNQTLTLSATSSDLDIASGTCIGVDFTGTLTSATGTITVLLAPAGSADDLRLVTGTFGSAPGAYVGTPDVKATSGTRRARFFVVIPDDYQIGESLTLRASAGMITTVADGSATVDFEAYRILRDGTLSADLVADAAQSINSLTADDFDFDLTITDVEPGDVLDVRASVAYVDAATATAVIAALYQASLLADVR